MRPLRLSRRHKYNAQKTKVNGHTFDSKAESEYFGLLKLKIRAGEIKYIDVHPVVSLPGGIRWKLDFFIYYPDGKIEAIDIKGFETQVFKMKQKLFNQFHPLAPLKVITKKGGSWYADANKI